MKPLLSALLIGALAMPALAQQPPRDAPTGRAARGPGERPDPAAMRRREGDDLTLVLGLSAAQRPALDAFLASREPRRPDEPPPAPGATPGDFGTMLGEMRARTTARGAEELARIDAAQRFYAQLDARQKQVFEALMRLRHGPGGPGRGGPGGPEHGPD